MNLSEFNNLVDLFSYQAEKENSQTSFLEWLNSKNRKKFTWGETSTSIYKLAKVLKKNIDIESLVGIKYLILFIYPNLYHTTNHS